jgi:hypothetical protein
MKALKRKSARELLLIGRQYRNAKEKMSPTEFAEWRSQRPELRHEARVDETVVDLDKRLARLDAMFDATPGLRKYRDRLPCTGVSAARELSKLGEFWLEKLLEVGLINPQTTRAQIDALRGLQTGKPVAPRHREAKQ